VKHVESGRQINIFEKFSASSWFIIHMLIWGHLWVHKPCLRNRITFGFDRECRVTGVNTVAPDTGNCITAPIGLVPYALYLGAIEMTAGLVCGIVNHTLMLAHLQNTKRFRNI
jgi:hypothetical protein